MNLTLPMFPVYFVDIVGSTLALGIAGGCVIYSWRLARNDKTNPLWTYLFWVSMAFAAFAIFRSVSHLIKYILIVSGHKDLWKGLSPLSGAVNSMAFVVVATLTFYYERIKKSYQTLLNERDRLQDANEEIDLLNENLRIEMNRIQKSEFELEEVHEEITRLIDQVRSGGDLSVRYNSPNLIRCWEFKDCIHEKCPAYKSGHLRCWHLGKVYCCSIKNQKIGQDCRCEECEVYLSTQKEPLSKIGEQFNDMMHILETKTKELQEVNRTLKEVDKRKSKFLDIVAHDLRTPLTSILSYADLLLRYKSEPEETKDEFLKVIIQESRRLGDLISDYLDLSKIEAGLLEYQIEPMNFREVIDHAVNVYMGACIEKEILIQTDSLPREMPLIGDQKRLSQVMSNLLSNASKFTPLNGGITIRAGVDVEGGKLRVSVSDTGPGIPESHVREIFKKFTQVQDGDLHTVGGTGIGLSICKEIVEFHGGRIWAENCQGGGACIHISLPIQGPPSSVPEVETKENCEDSAHRQRSS